MDGLVISLTKIDGFKMQLMNLLKEKLKEANVELSEAVFDENSLALFKRMTSGSGRSAQGVLKDYILPALCKLDKLEDGKNRLLVVDSLDEAVLSNDKNNNTILELVTELAETDKFPSWLKLVTSRPQESVTGELNNVDKIDLEAVLKEDTKTNLEDIRAYVNERMNWEVVPLIEYKIIQAMNIVNQTNWADIDVLKGYLEAVVEKSEGMFLYAVYTFDDIEKKSLSLGQSIEDFSEHLPKGLSGFYEKRFKAMGFGERGSERRRWYDKEIAPVLEVISRVTSPSTSHR